MLIDLVKAFDTVWLDGLIYKLSINKFPNHLIYTINNMISNKKFILTDGTYNSKIFKITEGLQQGTVNSPVLFNIFSANIIDLNTTNSRTHSIAFANDLIVYVADRHPKVIEEKLNTIFNKTNCCYSSWRLRLNPEKYQSILIRRPSNTVTKINGNKNHTIQLSTHIPGTLNIISVPHCKSVKYLGLHIDELLRLDYHITNQLKKAAQTFMINANLFNNKSLSTKAKIICYQLMLRPIITYASSLWWNVGATQMEELRKFERSCLRACISNTWSRKSNYTRRTSNKIIYEQAGIPRIDNYIIKVTRNYLSDLHKIKNNLINNLDRVDAAGHVERKKKGYLYPKDFMKCDYDGLIQDDNNIPIHFKRHRRNKKYSTICTTTPTIVRTNSALFIL